MPQIFWNVRTGLGKPTRLVTSILCAIVITATMCVVWLTISLSSHVFGRTITTSSTEIARLISILRPLSLPYALILLVVQTVLFYKVLSSNDPGRVLKGQAWTHAMLFVVGGILWFVASLKFPSEVFLS